ncbi:organomercurial transporter MerC [Ralstonia pickettii]|uniref:organomercurial transporter MerC n=1 Tax=Ralstonia pickettii TaxID=329 RepID=UPI00046A5794|nr:organomercurial transporter MerC [Ralstonia pickettii]
MSLITRAGDKAGLIGSVVSAMGCASCFPAIASLGAAIGLGFLSQYKGLFMTTLLPLFAALALLANALGWLSHRQWHRSLLGAIWPLLVLLAAMLIRLYGLPTAPLLYVVLALMVGVSLWDLVAPARRRCAPDGCELPPKRG